MRKNYIDNLRTLVILLLFPYHTLRMFNIYEIFYVEGSKFIFSDIFTDFCSVWFMNLLFVLAGISSFYSLQHRTLKEYYNNRLKKLLVPFLSGVLLTIPIQTYYAERQHNGYTGSYLHQYIMFFTKETDLSGYTGGFTPAHLWFLLFLFLIALISFPTIKKVKEKIAAKNSLTTAETQESIIVICSTSQLLKLILLFPIFWLGSYIDIGEPLGQYLAYFLTGLLILSKESTLLMLKQHRIVLAISAIFAMAVYLILGWGFYDQITWSFFPLFMDIYQQFIAWLFILGLIALAQDFFNFKTKISTYFSHNSFSIYFVHQTILVAVGYYILQLHIDTFLQFFCIMILTFFLSILSVEILKRIPVINQLFGMK